MAAKLPSRPVRSLQLICQIETIKNLHATASKIEREYFEDFCGHLSVVQQKQEHELDIRDLDLKATVDEFETRLKAKALEESKKKLKRKSSSQLRYSFSPKRLRSSKKVQNEAYNPQKPSSFLQEKEQNQAQSSSSAATTDKKNVIPSGFSAQEFITYKKCKLMLDVEYVRKFLLSHLNPCIVNNLMSTMENIMASAGPRGGSYLRDSILTVQMFLTNPSTNFVNFKPLKIWSSWAMRKKPPHSSLSLSFLTDGEPLTKETRAEPTMFQLALRSAVNLTHVQMAGAACDNFLKVISEHCTCLQYLDISDSVVSDKGLYYLAGVSQEESRASRLSRKCKQVVGKSSAPKCFVKTQRGCTQLTHFMANNLKKVNWASIGTKSHTGGAGVGIMASFMSHGSVKTCPRDSGFVMILKYLPKIKVLLSEMGGRILETMLAEKKKQKLSPLVNLEVISDHQITKSALQAILVMCPNIKSVIVRPAESGKNETWMEALEAKHKIENLHILEATFKGPNLCQRILDPVNGGKLTCLDVRELFHFRMSWLQKLKINCQNLQKLSIGISSRQTLNSLQLQLIDVIKDFNLGNGEGKDDPHLTKLELLHLVGPFGSDAANYLIKGAQKIDNLALMINWMDPAFCSMQPSSDKDFIGTEYLKSILDINPLDGLTQLHLSGHDRKSRNKLDKDCFNFVLTKFAPRLKHLGNFSLWNLKQEKSALISEICRQNRDLVLDEHLRTKQGDKSDFCKKFVENRAAFSCQNPNSLIFDILDDSRNMGIMADLFEVIAGLHGFLGVNEGIDPSDSEDSMDSDDGEDLFGDDMNIWFDDD